MHRRRFIALATLGSTGLAGCTAGTDGLLSTGTPRGRPDTHFVDPSGADDSAGTRDDPLGSIQSAVERAEPGETVSVNPGRYHEEVVTVRSGRPDAPIEITGPPDAFLHGSGGDDWYYGVRIRHSHVHLTGLTIDGFGDRSDPNDPTSYIGQGVITSPHTDEYLRDLVIEPHAIGNVRGAMVNLSLVEDVSVGAFRVIGPAGLSYELTGEMPGFAEIVYLGTGPGNVAREMPAFEPADLPGGLDQSNGVRVHHIDNSDGHAHAELVDVKLGAHDVTVEHCTDRNNQTPALRVNGHDVTVRWCDLGGGDDHGIEVGSEEARRRQRDKPADELLPVERLAGTRNALYRNRVVDFEEKAFAFPLREVGQSPASQRHLCDNEVTRPTDGDPAAACPDGLPTADRIGHLGGDSPWA